MYSLREYARMGWGKLRRAFLVTFRRGRVAEKLDRRRGACTRCGACCKIMFQCPAYDDADGNPKCLIYNDRPGVCSLFPLDEKDLRDRDIVMSGRKCGFYFDDAPRADGERRPAQPLRFGPSRENGEGVRVGGSAVAMVKFLFQKTETAEQLPPNPPSGG